MEATAGYNMTEHERRLFSACAGSAAEALIAAESGEQGLSAAEAEKRLIEYGSNDIAHGERVGFSRDILRRCRSP